MQGVKIMQLILIIALLLFGGRSSDKLLSEVKPVLEEFGGEEMKQALKNAEEISEALSAVKELSSSLAPQSGFKAEPQQSPRQQENGAAISFPLSPVSSIADRDITYCLSRYFSCE